jgi:hypothetical protein
MVFLIGCLYFLQFYGLALVVLVTTIMALILSTGRAILDPNWVKAAQMRAGMEPRGLPASQYLHRAVLLVVYSIVGWNLAGLAGFR